MSHIAFQADGSNRLSSSQVPCNKTLLGRAPVTFHTFRKVRHFSVMALHSSQSKIGSQQKSAASSFRMDQKRVSQILFSTKRRPQTAEQHVTNLKCHLFSCTAEWRSNICRESQAFAKMSDLHSESRLRFPLQATCATGWRCGKSAADDVETLFVDHCLWDRLLSPQRMLFEWCVKALREPPKPPKNFLPCVTQCLAAMLFALKLALRKHGRRQSSIFTAQKTCTFAITFRRCLITSRGYENHYPNVRLLQ